MVQKIKAARELGYTGLDEWHGRVSEQWINDLRTSAKRVQTYDEMARMDSTGAAVLQTTSILLRGADIHVTPASQDDEDIEIADFIEHCLNDMSKSWQEVMGDIVHFLTYGFFDVEIVYKERNDGKIGWKKWAPRHPVTLDRWIFDENGGLQGMRQRTDRGDVEIPIEKLLHFTTTGVGKNNPEGRSIFEGAYAPWFFIKNLSIQEAIVCERMAGTPVMKLPPDVDEDDPGYAAAEKVVRNIKLGDDMGLVEPDGYEFRYEMPNGRMPVDIGKVIERHQKEFATVVLMDFILLGGGDAGSHAMVKDKSALYVKGLNTYLSIIAAIINQHAIPRLLALNGIEPEDGAFPKVYFDQITKIDVGDYAEVIRKLFDSGAVTYDMDTENEVRREIGLHEIDEPGIMMKANMAANRNPDLKKDKQESQDEKQEPQDEKQESKNEEKYEFAEVLDRSNADDFADYVAMLLIQRYDKITKDLPAVLARAEQSEIADILSEHGYRVAEELLDEIYESTFNAWRATTGERPNADALVVIVSMLTEQRDRLRNHLRPDFERKVLEAKQKATQQSMPLYAAEALIESAIAAFRYRVSLYASAIFQIHANHAHAYKSYTNIKARYPNADVIMDWDSGLLEGDLVGRYVGPDDKVTCEDCDHELSLGWHKNPAPIGSLRCGPNCRHSIEWKYRSRVF